jgi:hypothetical protein
MANCRIYPARIARNKRILVVDAPLRHPLRGDGLLRDWRPSWLKTAKTILMV